MCFAVCRNVLRHSAFSLRLQGLTARRYSALTSTWQRNLPPQLRPCQFLAPRLPYDRSLGIAGVSWMICKEKKVKLTRMLFVVALLAALALPVLADDIVYDTVY